MVIEAGSMTFPNFYLLPLTTVDSAAWPGSKIIVIELPHAVIKTFLSAEARPNYCAKFRKLRLGVGKVVEQRKFIEFPLHFKDTQHRFSFIAEVHSMAAFQICIF